jgi:hypothetical protein
MNGHDPRKYADECLRQAEVARSEADRLMLLDMAEGWLRIAEREEKIAALEAGVRRTSNEPGSSG